MFIFTISKKLILTNVHINYIQSSVTHTHIQMDKHSWQLFAFHVVVFVTWSYDTTLLIEVVTWVTTIVHCHVGEPQLCPTHVFYHLFECTLVVVGMHALDHRNRVDIPGFWATMIFQIDHLGPLELKNINKCKDINNNNQCVILTKELHSV